MTESPEPQKRIRYYYLKSQGFRGIHVDGAIGGLAPNGRGLVIGLFSERGPYPQQVEFDIRPEGAAFKLGDEVPGSAVGKQGIVRELEVEAFMDLQTARAIQGWLAQHIVALEKGVSG